MIILGILFFLAGLVAQLGVIGAAQLSDGTPYTAEKSRYARWTIYFVAINAILMLFAGAMIS